MSFVRRGQVAVYLLVVLTALTILALMNVDTFLSVRDKFRSENAGDAAALAAASVQGRLLNEIGELNLEHISAALKDDTNAVMRIQLLQREKALLGPLDAVSCADEAARKNGATPRKEYSDILHEHADTVRFVYAAGDNNEGDPYPESWPFAWEAYAAKIDQVAGAELAAGVDNIDFYDLTGGHPLLDKNFYNAVSARDWCWFFFHMNNVLENYGSFHDWAPLPRKEVSSYDNSEIFPLYVKFRTGSILDYFKSEELAEIMNAYDYKVTAEEIAENEFLKSHAGVWAFLDTSIWRRWSELDDLPMTGEVKEEYDLRGAAAISRVELNDIVWTAAAKPFGIIDIEKPKLVLPVFSAVRLVPVDSVGGAEMASADYEWIMHLRHHLVPYLLNGPKHDGPCRYCAALADWEKRAFRASGVKWLKFNSGSCVRPVPGHGSTGGTVHGH